MANSTVRQAFLVIGDNSQNDAGKKLRDVLEKSSKGSVKVSDLKNVMQSEGSSFDEKLRRHIENFAGVLLFCSPTLKDGIDKGTSISVQVSGAAVQLNCGILRNSIQDCRFRKKFIPLSSEDTPSLPRCLNGVHVVKLPEKITEKKIKDGAAKQIITILHGLPSQ